MKNRSSVAWILVIIVFGGGLQIATYSFGTTKAPFPKPMIDINQALKLAIDFSTPRRNTSDCYLSRAWIDRNADGKDEHWIFLWSTTFKDKQTTEERILVEVHKDRSVSFQNDIPNWLGVGPDKFGPAPETDMIRAIELAAKHAGTTKKLAGFYIDRVWLGQVEGGGQRKWVVSWSPDVGGDGTSFWFKVAVDMKGHAEDYSGDVKWLPPQPVRTPPVLTPK